MCSLGEDSSTAALAPAPDLASAMPTYGPPAVSRPSRVAGLDAAPLATAEPGASVARVHVSRERLPAVGALRFVAALHLVLYHVRYIPVWNEARIPRWFTSFAALGYTTTSFFFMLSGFMLYYGYVAQDGTFRGTKQRFLLARAVRVLPLTFASQLVAFPLIFSPRVAAHRAQLEQGAAIAFLNLQAWVPNVPFALNVAAWTISALLFFYAVFPYLAEASGRLNERQSRLALVGMWLLGLLPGAIYLTVTHGWTWRGESLGYGELPFMLHYFPPARLAEFLTGALLARLYTSGPAERWPRSRWLLGAGVVLLLATWSVSDHLPRVLMACGLVGPAHLLIIAGAARLRRGWGTEAARRLGERLGNASLALYLIHGPIFSWSPWILKRVWGLEHQDVLLVPVLAIVAVASVVVSEQFITPIAHWVLARYDRVVTPAPLEGADGQRVARVSGPRASGAARRAALGEPH